MSIFSGLFRSRDKPQNRTSGSAYSFFFGESTAGRRVNEADALDKKAIKELIRNSDNQTVQTALILRQQLAKSPVKKIPGNAELSLQGRQYVMDGDYEMLELLYDSVPAVLSELICTAFIPRPGYKFIVSDFSALEARVLAFLACET